MGYAKKVRKVLKKKKDKNIIMKKFLVRYHTDGDQQQGDGGGE
tara:strand:+ start:1278 stop:1406 length:129 start_codon:yes stop_codon:yes gene_type:complete